MPNLNYKLANGRDAESLEKAVNDLLKQGYRLYGNPFIQVIKSADNKPQIYHLYQAMINDELEKVTAPNVATAQVTFPKRSASQVRLKGD